MGGVRDGYDEQTALLSRTPDVLEEATLRLAAAIYTGNRRDDEKARKDFAEIVGNGLILSDLLGRRRTVLEAKDAKRNAPKDRKEERLEPVLFGIREKGIRLAAEKSFVPSVTFEDAIEDLLSREPLLAQSGAEVAELYRTQHAFAVTNSAYLVTTKRVQKAVADLSGKGAFAAKDVLAHMGGWTRSYAETVYRTNLSTAYSAGRQEMAKDPVVAQVIGALLYVATKDSSVRPNHRAADGLIASQFDPIWETYRPPLGYNCRCGVRMVDRWDLEELGLLDGNLVKKRIPTTFRGAFPDPGFQP